MIAHEPNITAQSDASTQKHYVQRMQMMLSVDDIVDEVHELLRSTGTLNNTFLLFCADVR
jgi:arylsulfatase A-like enzyme